MGSVVPWSTWPLNGKNACANAGWWANAPIAASPFGRSAPLAAANVWPSGARSAMAASITSGGRSRGGDVVGRSDTADRRRLLVDRDAFAEHARVLRTAQARGVDEARRHGVDRDPLRPELLGQRARHRDDGPLRRRVVDLAGVAGLGAGGRDVDDASPAGLDHVGEHDLAEVEDAPDVDREDLLELLLADLEELRER